MSDKKKAIPLDQRYPSINDKKVPLHRRYPGKYAARLKLYDPDSTVLEFETSMSDAYGAQLTRDFVSLLKGIEPQRTQGASEPESPAADAEGDYVIMNVQISTGGMTYFWGPDSKGYTPDLDRAGRYTKERANKIISRLGSERKEVAVPFAEVDGKARRFVSDDFAHTKWYERKS
jgi:hypothetical protein